MTTNENEKFSQALDLIETNEPATVIRGIIMLEGIGDEKSLRVVAALAQSPIKAVRFQAERVLQKLSEAGCRLSSESGNQEEIAAQVIEDGKGILRQTYAVISKNFSAVFFLFSALSLAKGGLFFLLLEFFQLRGIFGAGFLYSILAFALVQAFYLPLVWHYGGSLFCRGLPGYVKTERPQKGLALARYIFLLKSVTTGFLPMVIIAVFALPLHFAVPLFLLFLPVSMKLYYLFIPLLPLQIMNLKLWQTPMENCLRVFARANQLMSRFLRPGFLLVSISGTMIFLLVTGLLFVINANLSLQGFWLGILAAESVVSPIWMCFRMVFSFLFFPEAER